MKKRLIVAMMTIVVTTGMSFGGNRVFAENNIHNEQIKYSETAVDDDEKNVETVTLKRPPFKYYCSDAKRAKKKVKAIKLTQTSMRANKIIDDEDWFKKYKLTRHKYQVAFNNFSIDKKLPDDMPLENHDLILTEAFYDTSYDYCVYGGDYSQGYIMDIYDRHTHKMLYSLDFSKYRYSPNYIKADYDYIEQSINWATIQNGILYVSTGHMTYAKSSKNMNAYITAIDLSDQHIIWRTSSLVSNAGNFIIVGNVILCGYGFTDEDDYLYQINRYNGKIITRLKLKTSPTYILQRNTTLYVRTYDTNYRFKMENVK